MLASFVRHLIAIDSPSPAILNSIVCNGPSTQPIPLRYGVLRKVAPCEPLADRPPFVCAQGQAQKRYDFVRLLAYKIARNNSF